MLEVYNFTTVDAAQGAPQAPVNVLAKELDRPIAHSNLVSTSVQAVASRPFGVNTTVVHENWRIMMRPAALEPATNS